MYPNPHPEFVDNKHFGFSFLSGSQAPAERMHRHNEIEIGLSEHGSVDALIGSTRIKIPPGQLIVFWAVHPHGPLAVEPGTYSHVVHIPLPKITESAVPIRLVRQLMEGRVILSQQPEAGLLPDLLLIKHWIHLLSEYGEEGQKLVLHEAIARLMRLSLELGEASKPNSNPKPPLDKQRDKMAHFTSITQLLSERFNEVWTSQRIAQEVGLNPSYMMRLFKEVSGTTLGEWLTQHRIAIAQSMLCTSQMKIEEIADNCGFGSLSSFYQAFKRVGCESPSAFRRRLATG